MSPAAEPNAAIARTRRSLLAAGLAGIGAIVAALFDRPTRADAAAGDNLKLGQVNYAGISATRLNATSSGGAFSVTQNASGSGVRGDSTNGHGGVFTTAHEDRFGLNGRNTASVMSAGAGVWGDGGNNIGVGGASAAGVGVFGSSTDLYGVHGYSTNSYAGYFSGPIHATSADANIKAFRIDHPLDPAHKVLMHSCVESDKRLTVYAGSVMTGADLRAIVRLPSWFEALNADLQYQLTTIGEARAWIDAKVANGTFVIATDRAGVEVSWQVTGVRRDAYATAHPLEVESRKTGREAGRYLTPLEHGQPASLGVDYDLLAASNAGRR